MREGYITLNEKEVQRLKILHKVMEGEVSQVSASEVLGIGDRQIRNLLEKLRKEGDRGIIHRNREKRSPRKMSSEREDFIAEIVGRRYADFGPTLAAEKLEECEKIKVSKEKLRQIMLAKGLWKRQRRKGKIYRWRERKAHLGQMVQMDGSHHDWLEGRGPWMVLMGYVDDATSRFFGRFYEYEGVFPAMDSLERYIRLYGSPVSLYLDKHSTYKTTREADVDELLRGEEAQTQFERAAKELGIRIIHADSPQAKGRIERTFYTHQDRLVKELRLAGVCTIEEANTFLETYLPLHNKRFTRKALKEGDLHRRQPMGIKFKDILCIKAKRKIGNDSTVRWRGRRFLVDNLSLGMRKQKVDVREHFDGQITIKFHRRYLDFHEIFESQREKVTKSKKRFFKAQKKKGKYIPPPDHPWKRYNPRLHHNCYLEKL